MELYSEIQPYLLPDTFWEHMLRVRDHLLRDQSFSSLVCNPENRDHPAVRSFWLVEAWAIKHIDEENERKSG